MKKTNKMNGKAQGILHLLIMIVVITALSVVSIVGIGSSKFGSVEDIRLGLDLAGGVSITYQAVKDDPSSEEMNDTIWKLQQRVDTYSPEAEVYQEGSNRINVDIPGVKDANEILAELGQAGSIQFITEDGEVVVDGKDVQSAEAKYVTNDLGVTEAAVLLSMTSEGGEKFAEATGANIGRTIKIVYDGEEIQAPVVQTKITGGEARITCKSMEEASELATYIRIGALPLELTELRSNIVGAKLGSEAIRTSLIAGAIGLILVIAFMIIMYRIPGIAASIALLIYVGIVLLVLSVGNITLTLYGIAGIILSVGMAVDANVIIFTRIREELATGKTVRSAIHLGFDKALSAIVDGNVTTLIAAVVLYLKGSGTFRGFALTLGLGILVSMFTALVVTRFTLKAFYNLGADDVKYYGVQKERKVINFTKNRKKYFAISGALILVGLVFLFINTKRLDSKSILNYGLEFVGGTSTQVTFPDDVTITSDDISQLYNDTVNKTAQSSKVEGENAFIIKSMELNLEERTKINDALVEKYHVDESLIQVENISATISSEMKKDAVVAVIIASICMLIYIWIRFRDINFGVSAVLALIHDVLVTLMLYAVILITVDNSFIACMLTIVGYSINATIVIFDRVRENKNNMLKKETIEDVVNKSITQTISRSINTSLTTFFMVFVLFILGVDNVRYFAGPLMMGIVCGAYSSICITATLWFTFKKRFGKTA